MSDRFRRVDDGFWVSGQIGLEDIAAAKALGVKVIVNNRPDGEQPGQIAGAALEAAAAAQGLAYVASPVRGGPAQADLDAMTAALAQGPTLAFCARGSRSILTWAAAQLTTGARERDQVLSLARNAGFDLSPWI